MVTRRVSPEKAGETPSRRSLRHLDVNAVLRLAQDYAGCSLIEYGVDGAVVHVMNQRLDGATAIPPVETAGAGEESA